MTHSFIKEKVKNIVTLLVAEEFDLLWLNDLDQRINIQEMREALSGYGKMTMPPSSSFDEINVYSTNDPNEVRVDFDLWFDGMKSDLTLKCTINNSEQKQYSIDDIRML
ncbi:hypothetical protein QF042_001899 [Pedobacter sp. W3I1]|uniref:DUF7668 domain-containing protein n=1 Tax=Pedobacter sp. W3I1 TaxID=3042291 RepID=UPI002780C44C|nr:hypothetical protein [Pedobacter sp. W3I1]MDQ0638334.1 hypothetical protein [Pedobacter sp. W3I1]